MTQRIWPPVVFVPKTPLVTQPATGAGNYTPKTNCLRITMIGAGGSPAGQGGGGGAEYIFARIYPCVAGTPIAYTVGAATLSSDGAASTFGTLTAAGGKHTNTATGGSGGGRLGAVGAGTVGVVGASEGLYSFGGSSGGGVATNGGPSEVFPGGVGGANAGGAASPFGAGGASAAAPAATAFGAGAGGGGGLAKGADGTIIIEEIGS